ncbi:uncharacterized protein BDW43DRAFT_171147 [Aspergillus alliaceus]|uniref:uncharacterized protein n=1 Tax=Petromyces alliaceus TaxID=209559 RepID=UPI0012A42D8A|nr:uncharacterized protein BDW43DRAFT_171147 [Aspergillus alliaceus]KAB8230068.1 hypothetical protein BDW43DRAFT_171147 [Aspergillus alliaceus]
MIDLAVAWNVEDIKKRGRKEKYPQPEQATGQTTLRRPTKKNLSIDSRKTPFASNYVLVLEIPVKQRASKVFRRILCQILCPDLLHYQSYCPKYMTIKGGDYHLNRPSFLYPVARLSNPESWDRSGRNEAYLAMTQGPILMFTEGIELFSTINEL